MQNSFMIVKALIKIILLGTKIIIITIINKPTIKKQNKIINQEYNNIKATLSKWSTVKKHNIKGQQKDSSKCKNKEISLKEPFFFIMSK